MKNVIVEPVRRVREDLIKRYGGIGGYFKYCQALDRALAARRKRRQRKPAGGATRKTDKTR